MPIAFVRKSQTPKAPPPTPKPARPTPPTGKLAGHPRPLELLTLKEAAAFAKISTQTLRRAIKGGGLKFYRAGRQIRIDESDLVDYISS